MDTEEEILKQLVDLRSELMIIDDVEQLCVEFLTRDIGNSTPLPEKEPVNWKKNKNEKGVTSVVIN